MISTEEIENNRILTHEEHIDYLTELLDQLDNLIRVTERRLRNLRREKPIEHNWTKDDEIKFKWEHSRTYDKYAKYEFDDKGNYLPIIIKE